MGEETIKFTVSFKKESYEFSLPPTTTVLELKDNLQQLSGIPSDLQKLLAKGQMKDEATLAQVPIVNGTKIMLIGTPQAVVDRKKEMKVERPPIQTLASRPVAVSRRAGPIVTLDNIGSDTRFGSIRVLEGWPNSEQARQILLKLSTDVSIVEVMKRHNWKVGVLSELTPLEYTKLGFNMNRGAEISLRLRFENGFRQYDSIKKVLYHELAHMEVDDHNNEFKTLNSQIKRECESIGPGRKLGSNENEDEQLEEVDHGGVGYRLGGDETQTTSSNLTPAQAAAQAALRRVGSSSSSSSSPSSSSPSPSSPSSSSPPSKGT